MLKIIRWIAVLAVWIAALITIHAWALTAWRCNNLERVVHQQTLRIATAPDPMRFRTQAVRNIESIEECCRRFPDQVGQAMLLAANYRFIGKPARAAEVYASILNYNRRPEVYFNLGEAQIAAGKYDLGLQNLITAALYNPSLVDQYPAYATQLRNAVNLHQLRLAAIRQGKE